MPTPWGQREICPGTRKITEGKICPGKISVLPKHFVQLRTLLNLTIVQIVIRVHFYNQKFTKIRLWPGLRLRPRWGSSRCSPDPLVGWGGGSLPHSTPLASCSTILCPSTNLYKSAPTINIRIQDANVACAVHTQLLVALLVKFTSNTVTKH